MGRFDIQGGIEMILRKIEGLGISRAKVDPQGFMGSAAIPYGFGILVDASVGSRAMVAHHERCATPVSTADLEDFLSSQVGTTRDMMIELDGGAVRFILRLKLDRFALFGPVSIVQERDWIAADTAG